MKGKSSQIISEGFIVWPLILYWGSKQRLLKLSPGIKIVPAPGFSLSKLAVTLSGLLHRFLNQSPGFNTGTAPG